MRDALEKIDGAVNFNAGQRARDEQEIKFEKKFFGKKIVPRQIRNHDIAGLACVSQNPGDIQAGNAVTDTSLKIEGAVLLRIALPNTKLTASQKITAGRPCQLAFSSIYCINFSNNYKKAYFLK